jgi:hypothetical protein
MEARLTGVEETAAQADALREGAHIPGTQGGSSSP